MSTADMASQDFLFKEAPDLKVGTIQFVPAHFFPDLKVGAIQFNSTIKRCPVGPIGR